MSQDIQFPPYQSPSNLSNLLRLFGNQSEAEQTLYQLHLYQPDIRLDSGGGSYLFSCLLMSQLCMETIMLTPCPRIMNACGTGIPAIAIYLIFTTLVKFLSLLSSFLARFLA